METKSDYIYFSNTDIGKSRKANEDFYGDSVSPSGHVFVVCDGMGGHLGGSRASQIAVESILEYFNQNTFNDPTQLVSESIKFANAQVHGSAESDPSLKGMGTTCVVLLLSNDMRIIIGHVGDSRVYQLYENSLIRLTKDHSFVQFLVDSGEISETEAESHPDKNQILRALGSDETVKPDVMEVIFNPEVDNFFLLCTDGLSGMISDERIFEIIKSNDSDLSDDTLISLISAALDEGGKDNITATIIQLKSTQENTSITPSANVENLDKTIPFNPLDQLKTGFTRPLNLIKALIVFLLITLLSFIVYYSWKNYYLFEELDQPAKPSQYIGTGNMKGTGNEDFLEQHLIKTDTEEVVNLKIKSSQE